MKHENLRLKKEKQELIHQLNQRKKQLQKISRYDPLTKLPNREKLVEDFNKAVGEGETSGKAIFLMDIDRFHSINELYGRNTGDQLLYQVGKRLQKLLGQQKAVFYNGEDEFCVILNNISYFEIRNIGKEIHRALAAPFEIEGRILYITTSVGMSHYPMTAHEIDLLLLQAEIALNKVKSKGKNGVQVFLLEDAGVVERKRRIEFGLKVALKNKEMFLVYQPKVALTTGQVYSVEALLRWRHPTLGLISPTEFIPIAEESGMIIEIGYWVIKEAIRQTKEWHNAGLELSTSVNVSAIQFSDKRLVERIVEKLTTHQLEPKYLMVEITESVMRDLNHAKRVIRELHENNIQIAIDDFGTGYSSLGVLNTLSIDMIKIDRSFIQNIPVHPKSASLVKTIIQMGANLGFDIIAEGIETLDQSKFLIDNCCQYGQGFYYSKPIPSTELVSFVQKKCKP